MMRLRAAFPRFAVLAILAFISLAPSRSNELFQDGRLQHTGLIVAAGMNVFHCLIYSVTLGY
jgi:hypothetical protein